MKQYKDLLYKILTEGERKEGRNGDTLSLFGTRMEFDLNEGFPLVTSKFTSFNAIIGELLWFLKGDTNIKSLNSKIWDAWADDSGGLGPIYGSQWKTWGGRGVDQIANVIGLVKTNPGSRRMVVSAWNPLDLPDESISSQENVSNGKMALAPCHVLFQLYVHEGVLSCQVYQRSCDTFLGLPYNVASYAALTCMIAAHCGLSAGKLVWVGGDTHLYGNHVDAAWELLKRPTFPLPGLEIRGFDGAFDFEISDFTLIGYEHGPAIRQAVSV
jgi:thymidylate synthase